MKVGFNVLGKYGIISWVGFKGFREGGVLSYGDIVKVSRVSGKVLGIDGNVFWELVVLIGIAPPDPWYL